MQYRRHDKKLNLGKLIVAPKINTEITIEDIREWKEQLDKSGIIGREYKIYAIADADGNCKAMDMFKELLLKRANEVLNR